MPAIALVAQMKTLFAAVLTKEDRVRAVLPKAVVAGDEHPPGL
jgi:hypothetical protein